MMGTKRGGWAKRGQRVRQLLLVHYLQNFAGLIRKYWIVRAGMDT